MPCECPIAVGGTAPTGCSATPWVLNIKTHLARRHPMVPPHALDLTESVVVSRGDEKKKKEPAKKILMFPRGMEVFNSNGTLNSDALIDYANCILMVCTCICSCCFSVNLFYTAYAWWYS